MRDPLRSPTVSGGEWCWANARPLFPWHLRIQAVSFASPLLIKTNTKKAIVILVHALLYNIDRDNTEDNRFFIEARRILFVQWICKPNIKAPLISNLRWMILFARIDYSDVFSLPPLSDNFDYCQAILGFNQSEFKQSQFTGGKKKTKHKYWTRNHCQECLQTNFTCLISQRKPFIIVFIFSSRF